MKKKPDELTKMVERYAITKLIQKYRNGCNFFQLKSKTKIKESRLSLRLKELEDKGYIIADKQNKITVYLSNFREE